MKSAKQLRELEEYLNKGAKAAGNLAYILETENLYRIKDIKENAMKEFWWAMYKLKNFAKSFTDSEKKC